METKPTCRRNGIALSQYLQQSWWRIATTTTRNRVWDASGCHSQAVRGYAASPAHERQVSFHQQSIATPEAAAMGVQTCMHVIYNRRAEIQFTSTSDHTSIWHARHAKETTIHRGNKPRWKGVCECVCECVGEWGGAVENSSNIKPAVCVQGPRWGCDPAAT